MADILLHRIQTERLYVIRPNLALTSRLQGSQIVEAVLASPKLWTIVFDRGPFLSNYSAPTELKLLILANLKQKWGNSSSVELREFINDLLKPPLGSATFDRWWMIETVKRGNDFGFACNHIPIDILKSFSKSGDVIADDWLEELIKEREADSESQS